MSRIDVCAPLKLTDQSFWSHLSAVPVKAGDVVESAGFGGFFPKGLLVGRVRRAWKEPGQIYQVAEVDPATDLSRLEEVACLV